MREAVADGSYAPRRKERMQEKLWEQLVRQHPAELEVMLGRLEPRWYPEISTWTHMPKCPELPEPPVASLPATVEVPRISTHASCNSSHQIAQDASSCLWSVLIVVVMLLISNLLRAIVKLHDSDITVKWTFAVKELQYCQACRSKIRKAVDMMNRAGAGPRQLDCKCMRALVEAMLDDGEYAKCYEKAAEGKNVFEDAKRLILMCEKKVEDAKVKKSKLASKKDPERSIGDENREGKVPCQEHSTSADSTIRLHQPIEAMDVEPSGWTMVDAADNQFDDSDYDMLEERSRRKHD
jgi:hypothetical protein